MILVSLLLAALGVADLFRSPEVRITKQQNVVGAFASVVVLWLLCLGLELHWAVPAVGSAAVIGWIAATADRTRRRRPWSVLGLGVGVGVLMGASGVLQQPTSGWLFDWYAGLQLPALAGIDLGQALAIAASAVFLINTANLAIRILLEWFLKDLPKTEKNVPGGRVVGPLERLFIFGLALAGEYLAVGAIVAAKSILRYPEIKDVGARKEAEYVLIGSLLSWGTALILVAMVR